VTAFVAHSRHSRTAGAATDAAPTKAQGTFPPKRKRGEPAANSLLEYRTFHSGGSLPKQTRKKAAKRAQPSPPRAYEHPESKTPLRPDVGTQAQFRKKKPPKTYRYDSSLSPALSWDGQNPGREVGEWLLALIGKAAALPAPHEFPEPQSMEWNGIRIEVRGLLDAVEQLKRLGRPFLDWAGKAERLSFDVPTLPLFVHERLSTTGILETLKGHKRDRQMSIADLFGDPQRPVSEQILRAYEYQDDWVNRMILGDSLVVMNSLLQYEGLGGQVQMIYMDPPYGVKFGSNFQPFVRKRDVKHNDDEDMTREPEMVKAYRDTWELGLHSYLTYMRDRLLLARDLLTPSGSIFVQISDENLHHVRELMDEVFGERNQAGVVAARKTAAVSSPTARTNVLPTTCDYILWYAKDLEQARYRQLYLEKPSGDSGAGVYSRIEVQGVRRRMTSDELANPKQLPEGARVYRLDNLTSSGWSGSLSQPVSFQGSEYGLPGNLHWKTTPQGMARLISQGRVERSGNSLAYVRYHDDFPVTPLTDVWLDTGTGSFTDPKLYVVQTNTKVIQRCLLMTTDPGDLVLDPTCGSGTTAYVAEQWGRRWVTVDTSRVPLALARQRLLTATYDYYRLKDESRGPIGGFVYERKQNNKGEEVGGIVPHVTLKSIANDEPPAQEVLVDRPETDNKITRVSGPFWFEATIPTPVDLDDDGQQDSGAEAYGSFIDRMIGILRRSPVLHVGGKRTVTLRSVRPPAKTLSLSAEAVVDASDLAKSPSLGDVVQEAREKAGDNLPFSQRRVALVFGPENGAVSEKLVFQAAREAHAKGYDHLYVIGFAIQPHARTLVETCDQAVGIAATYVQATPDIMMGDLLKTMRSSQIFSVCGLPEVELRKAKPTKDEPERYTVELLGLDVFDPATLETVHREANDVPAWFLDTDYNELCFHVCQAFFPRTAAWDSLKRALKAEFEESVWDHLAGTKSAPFVPGDQRQIAVKVIDDRGNELLVVKPLREAR
jgi:adenine-specific DNA-methyltransferase